MQRSVVLVNRRGRKLGVEEIFMAHTNPGLLHRAISVMLWRKRQGKIEMLLQQRSGQKPLWPLYWANTVCTHPFPGERVKKCAMRRLTEELGIEYGGSLNEAFQFNYQADYSDQYSEHEHDHVLVGEFEGVVTPNASEVANYKWIEMGELSRSINESPEEYTPWLKLIFNHAGFKKAMNSGVRNRD